MCVCVCMSIFNSSMVVLTYSSNVCKEYLALNNPCIFICHKTPNQTKSPVTGWM